MFNLKVRILKKFFNWWYRKHPPEMVEWWMNSTHINAAVVATDEGYRMLMEGEKYPQRSHPRGHILFGRLSKLKHEVKNQIFNDVWRMLEENIHPDDIRRHLKDKALPEIFRLADSMKYDMVPSDQLSPVAREIWRALSKVELTLPQERAERCQKLKEIICHILNEDDAYCFRFQWVAGFIDPNSWWNRLTGKSPVEVFEWGLRFLEDAEVVGDMKERDRLFLRIISEVLKDPETRETFTRFARELDWKKVRLSKGDKYFFRGKYFKVDYPYYEY